MLLRSSVPPQASSACRSTAPGATTIAGNGASRTLTLGTSGIIAGSGAGAVTIGLTGSNTPLTVNGTQTWTNNSSNLLRIFNAVNTAGSVGSDITVTGSGSTLIDGAISGAAGRVISIRKEGTGLLRLAGANTFSGGLTLVDGTVSIEANNAIQTGTFTIGTATTSVVLASPANRALGTVPQAWNGDFTFTGLNGPLGLGSGAVTLGGNRTVTVGGTQALTVAGAIGDGGSGSRIRYVLPRHKAATWVGRGRGRKPTRPGANGVVELTPVEFLDRLADLVPPPRKHRHRYHGVFAPNHKLRPAVTALAIGNIGKRGDATTGGHGGDGMLEQRLREAIGSRNWPLVGEVAKKLAKQDRQAG